MSKIEISQVGKFDNSRRFFNILPRQFFGFFDPRISQLSVRLVINPNNHFWLKKHMISVKNDHFLHLEISFFKNINDENGRKQPELGISH